jgi:hypothetical protein
MHLSLSLSNGNAGRGARLPNLRLNFPHRSIAMRQCGRERTCHFACTMLEIACTMPDKDKAMLSPLNAGAANLADMAARAGVRTVAAAWPSEGFAHLGLMVTACERCDATEVCSDWLARAPGTIGNVPPFCPNAGALAAARKARS